MRVFPSTQILTLAIVLFLFCIISIPAMAQEEAPSPSQEAAPQETPAAPEEAAPQEEPGTSEETTPEETTASPEEAAPQAEPAAPKEAPPVALEDISIISTRVQERPEGVDISAAPRRELELRPNRNFVESLQSIPGISTQQGNGPRDFNISIRGFGAKTSFGIRNVKMYEDGISQTQSDGLSRLDLHDPWFMQSVEVLRGPSSSLYDNYALGGVLFFRSRRGSDIMGTEADVTLGSWGYQKYGGAYGWNTPNADVALMASYVTENGYIRHSENTSITENLNFRYHIDDRQDIYFKLINNDLNADVPTRLTMGQYKQDPRQSGGVGTQTAVQLAQNRKDRRTILGVLYERQLDSRTLLTMEGDYDVKDINQTFGTISANVNPNFKTYADLRHDGFLAGMPLKTIVGFFFNYMEQKGDTFQNAGDFNGTRGLLTQNTNGFIRNIGGRVRGELEFLPNWIAVAGVGIENSLVSAKVTNYCYTALACGGFPGPPAPPARLLVQPNQTFMNYAPEVSITHRNSPDTKQWVRASTGYGIPGIGNMTTGLDGLPGFNPNVKPQKNGSIEIGTDTQISPKLSLQLVGFWTLFKDEIITQNTNANAALITGSYSINADQSQYRGIEAGAKAKPFKGAQFTATYTYIDATYKDFTDQYVIAGVITPVSRDGNEVPAVPKNILYGQAAYDAPFGLGGFVEARWVGSYYANNANTLKAPEYTVVNANLHYIRPFPETSWLHFIKMFVEMDNVFNRTYIASTAVVSDATADAGKQAFFAGYARSVYGGVTLGF